MLSSSGSCTAPLSHVTISNEHLNDAQDILIHFFNVIEINITFLCAIIVWHPTAHKTHFGTTQMNKCNEMKVEMPFEIMLLFKKCMHDRKAEVSLSYGVSLVVLFCL